MDNNLLTGGNVFKINPPCFVQLDVNKLTQIEDLELIGAYIFICMQIYLNDTKTIQAIIENWQEQLELLSILKLIKVTDTTIKIIG